MKFYIFFISFFVVWQSFPIVVGSNTAVSVEPFFVFPAADSDNTMLGFGWFKNGFALEDSSTTCTFDTVYPVSGTINCNQGTLILLQDLHFQNPATLLNLGNIKANNHILDFSATITSFPSQAVDLHDVKLFFKDDIEVDSLVRYHGNCLVDGNGNTIILGDNAQIIIEPNSRLILRNIQFDNVATSKIRCVDNSAQLVLDNVKLVLNGDYAFYAGSITFFNQVGIFGSYQFNYDSSLTSTIMANSEVLISEGIHLSIGRKNDVEPLFFTDKTSVLKFDHCSFIVTSSGITLARGSVEFSRDVIFDVNSTTTQNGFIWGNGQADEDLNIKFNPGSAVIHQSGYFVYNNFSPDRIEAPSEDAKYTRKPGSLTFLATSVNFPPFSVEATSFMVAPIESAPEASLRFKGSTIILPGTEFTFTGKQVNAFTYLLNGNETLGILKGNFPLALQINQSSNQIFGNGNFAGPIFLTDSNTQATFSILGSMLNDISLNNGTIILDTSLYFGPGNIIIGPGRLNLQNSALIFGKKALVAETSIFWDGTGAVIQLQDDLDLKSTWTISGNITIDGGDNTLDIAEGALIIDNNAELTLKNIRVKSLSNTNIRTLNDSGSLTLDNSSLILNNDFAWTKGSMQFLNHVDLMGTYTFLIDSACTSTITANTNVCISNRMNFSIGRKTPGGSEPIYFVDPTSIIRLSNCSLQINENGAKFTTGTLVMEKDVQLDIKSTSTSNGLYLGNGNPAEDLIIELSPGSNLTVNKGHIVFDLDVHDGIRSQSRTARLFRASGSTFFLKNNIVLSEITLAADIDAQLILEEGKIISYKNVFIDSGVGIFEVDGTQLGLGLLQLIGNQQVFLRNGFMDFYTIVTGQNNSIEGSGSIRGQIIFGAPTASLTYGIDGLTFQSIPLNGGSLTLSQNLNFAKNAQITVGGTVDISKFKVNLGPGDLTWNAPIVWTGDGGVITLDSKLSLDAIWVVNGDLTIDGGGNTLAMLTNGQILVGSNSTLVLRNIKVQEVDGIDIACIDNTGTIVLEDVEWLQNGLYQFNFGNLRCKSRVLFNGANSTLAYQSSQPLVIETESRLILDQGFTFSYDPVQTASKDLLQFADQTSRLVMRGATLHTTLTGLNIVDGHIDIKRDSFFSSERKTIEDEIEGITSEIDEGITIGSDSGQETILDFLNGASLTCTAGSINYKNQNVASFMMLSTESALQMNSQTRLNLFESLDLQNGKLILQNNTILASATDATVIGVVIPEGEFFNITL